MTLPYDELNELRTRLEEEAAETSPSGEKRYDPKKACDIILDYLVFCYVMGVDNANEMMGTSYVAQFDELNDAVTLRIEGENYIDRVTKYAMEGDMYGMMLVAETDATRLVNTGAETTAIKGGARYKQWQTMEDDRVRDTHQYLQGMQVGINDRFVTYDGDSARFPGDFSLAENNCNCRCWLNFS